MVPRKFWMERIEGAWKRRSIIWLAGVRRVGKTFLCKSLDHSSYYDCELPRVRHQLEDPERFLEGQAGKRVILDEIHRLDNPAELLKIAADHFPSVHVIATGSSTLGASRKFKDTLTGRKTRIHLTPMLAHETTAFDGRDLLHRLLNGGLPPFFMEDRPHEADYQEWLSSYWAKDIRELYQVEKPHSFLKFIELMLAHSGSLFEATRFAAPCEVSRTTIANYLSVLAATFVVYIVRPFSSSLRAEIVSAPKVYGFDTGFVCHARGWTSC
ncbi:MAG: ATP-binding protein [Parachlamydiales bacterium]